MNSNSMSLPTRRNLLRMLASTPVLAYGGFASAPQTFAFQAERTDPTDALVLASVRSVFSELNQDPSRLDSLRAFETTLMFAAMHAQHEHDDRIKQHIRRLGRTTLIDQMMQQHDHLPHEMRRLLPDFDPTLFVWNPLTSERASVAIDTLRTQGASAHYARLARTIKEKGERDKKNRGQVQLVSARVVQPGTPWCTQSTRESDATDAIAGAFCAIAFFFPPAALECAIASGVAATMKIIMLVQCG